MTIEQDKALIRIKLEGRKAEDWRKGMKLSRRQLAELTGYSERTIAAIEAGQWADDKPIEPKTLHTYRLVCAAIHVGAESFDWESVRLDIKNASLTIDRPDDPDLLSRS